MSAYVCNSLGVCSPLKVEEEASIKGIVTILGSDSERPKIASLRRTLSADMSSKKWLSQNGFSPIKRIASSQQFPVPVEEENCPGQDDVWRSIQEKKELQKPGQLQDWSSILCHKSEDHSTKLLPSYVHPLMKRSARSMSDNSLQICTESLGSETGSDGFSVYSQSESGDTQDDKLEVERQEVDKEMEVEEDMDYSFSVKKCPPSRSFPPSLPSLSLRHIKSRREGGRLVLESVTFKPENYFQADRHDGRLLLTFVDNSQEEAEEEEHEPDYDVEREEKKMCVIDKRLNDVRILVDQSPKLVPSGVISVHRSAFVVKNFMGIYNMNPIWTTNKFNNAVKMMEMEAEEEEEVEVVASVARLAPKPPAMATAAVAATASFNTYEYFWKTKPKVASMINPIAKNTNPKAYEKQDLVLLRTNCKEGRRSLLFWEPYCIATS